MALAAGRPELDRRADKALKAARDKGSAGKLSRRLAGNGAKSNARRGPARPGKGWAKNPKGPSKK